MRREVSAHSAIGVREAARLVCPDPGGPTVVEQAIAYEKMMGREAFERQHRAERRRRGLCVCAKRRLLSSAERFGSSTPYALADQRTFTWHEPDCARRQAWMAAYDPIPRRTSRVARAIAEAAEKGAEVVDLASRRKEKTT